MAVAKWWKVDFHTHTPASRCFKNFKSLNENDDIKNELAIAWIEKSIENKLNAVVVCDHNSMGWIEILRNINNQLGNKIVIYPGIELCTTINKMHIIIIFDPASTEEMHRTFMEQCKLPKNIWGDTEKYVNEDDLITAIEYFKKEYKEKILLIPAHYDKTKGMGKSLTEEGIKEFIKKIKIDAIEIRDEDGEKRVKQDIKKQVLPNIATVIGSDNPGERLGEHSIEGLGEKYTWIKMSEPSLEGMRQALLDYDSRVIKPIGNFRDEYNPNEIDHSYLSGITVNDLKHIKNINVRFSPNLNCIVGPRGAGKSTIIESIKLALNKGTNLKNLKVINKTYTTRSNIDLYYNFGSSRPYKITINGRRSLPKCTVIDSNEKIVDESPEFNAVIFEQKEIFNIVENEEDIEKSENSPLLDIIDGNITIDKIDIEEDINKKREELLKLAEDLTNKRKKLKEIPKIRAEIEKSSSQLEKFRTTGILDKKERLDKLKRDLELIKEKINTIKDSNKSYLEMIKTLINEYSIIEKNDLSDEGKYLFNLLLDKLDIFNNIINIFEKDSLECFSNIDNITQSSSLYESIVKNTNEYNNLLEENTDIKVEQYKEISNKNTNNILKLEKLNKEIENNKKIESDIIGKIDEYIDIQKSLTYKRKLVIDEINKNAENIRLDIHSMSHGVRWIQNLRKDVGKKDYFDSQFEQLYDSLFQNEILNVNKYKEWLKFLLTTDTGDINEFLESDQFDMKFKNIWETNFKNNRLTSLMNINLEDRAEIKILNGNNEISINEGSPGQKSAAILAFILNQGNEPLIIDQPEDDLDNSLIINLIVDNIRKQKLNRQIIIVTHNPNIPVLGDAEGIIMLDRNQKGEVSLKFNKATGCIEEKRIKEGICEIMEGGIEAFEKRENKYKALKI